MNKYGALLMRQWKRADPQRFSEIPDPEEFFAAKGTELEQEISTLAASLAGPDRAGETYMEKVSRLATARFNAESDLLREAMIPDPDDVETPLPAEWRSVAWEDPADE